MRIAACLLVLASAVAAQTPSPEDLFRQGKFDDAKAAAQALIARNKNDLTGIFWMGRVLEAQEKFGESAEWFEKAVKLNDTSAVYHLWLGNAVGGEAQNASKLRQPFLAKKVKSEYERAVALDPRLIDARMGLVEFYTQAPGFMGGSREKAKAQIEEIKKLHPFRGHFKEAELAQREKDFAAEGKAYAAAHTAGPDSAATYYALAGYYRRQTRWDDAFAMYDEIMKKFPSEFFVHANYASAAALSGKNLERGEREVKTFFTKAPKDVSAVNLSFVHLRLGMIYEKTGRKELARAEYNESLKQNPKNEEAKKAIAALK